MRITFSPELILHTNGHTCIEAQGNTVGDCMEAAFNRFPQLLVFFTSNKAEEADKTSITLNGEYLIDADSVWRIVSPDDMLTFGRDIPEGESSGLRTVIGAAVLIAAIALAPASGGTSLVWGMSFATWSGIGVVGASLMLGGLAELVAGTPKLPGDFGTASSPTYAFSGIQNTTAPGTPIPVVYGKHRVGGHVTNVYTQVLFDQNNYLFTQLGVSEGEIADISEVEINKRPAEEYQSTSLYWRAGTLNQQVPAKRLTIEENSSNVIELPAFRSGETVVLFDYGMTHTPYNVTNAQGTTFNKVDVRCMNEHDRSPLYNGDVFMWLEGSNGVMLADKKTFSVGGDREVIVSFEFADFTGSFSVRTESRPVPEYATGAEVVDPETGYALPSTYYEPYYNGTFHLLSVSMFDTKSEERDTAPAMYGFNTVQNSVSYDLLITAQEDDYLSGGAWFTTKTEVDTVYVSVVAPALTANGGGATVTFKVGYRDAEVASTAPNTPYTLIKTRDSIPSEIHTISHATGTSSEVFKGVVVDGLPHVGKWEIILWRETKDSGGNINVVDDIYLRDATEVSSGGHIHPHTALLGVKIKATEQLSGGLPAITSLVKGVKVKLPAGYNGSTRTWETPWNGEMAPEKAWTDNNVWCLYDLITNERYGLGKYFKIRPEKVGLMLANFVVMANYCDQRLNLDGTAGPINVVDIYGGSKIVVKPVIADGIDFAIPRTRFSLNVVIDESKSAIEWLNIICASMRASLYYTEGCVFIDIDRPKPVTQIFNMSNITEYTQSQASRSGVPNTYEVQFVDQDKNYEAQFLQLEDPAFQLDPTLEKRSMALQLRGVTDERQVKSLAKYALYAAKTARTSVSFKTGTQGLRSMIGDVIGVQHDVPQWGAGGKIKGCEIVTDGIYRITLNTEVEIQAGLEYNICIASPGQTPETVSVFEEVGVSNTISIQPPTFVPTKGDDFIIGLTTNTVKPFRVISLARDTDERITVTAVEYNESLYSAVDNILEGAGGVTNTPYETIKTPYRLSVSNVVATEKVYLDSAGLYKTGIVITYSPPLDVYWAGVTLYYGLDGYSTQLPLNRDGYIFIPEVLVSGTYKFALVSRYTDGSVQALNEAIASGAGSILSIDIYVSLAEAFSNKGISGLAIENKGNDDTFLGKDCVVTWFKPLVYDPDVAAGEEVAGAATTQTNNLLSHYLVEVSAVDGNIRRFSKTTKETYTYTHEANHEDGITRTFVISVAAVDIYGRASAPKSITCTNPAPPAIA